MSMTTAIQRVSSGLLLPMAIAFSAASCAAEDSKSDAKTKRLRVVMSSDFPPIGVVKGGNVPNDRKSDPDDMQSMVVSTGCWKKSQRDARMLDRILAAYGKVVGNLNVHAKGFPSLEYLKSVSVMGQKGYGMGDVGDGKDSPGSELIIASLDKDDPRPVCKKEDWPESASVVFYEGARYYVAGYDSNTMSEWNVEMSTAGPLRVDVNSEGRADMRTVGWENWRPSRGELSGSVRGQQDAPVTVPRPFFPHYVRTHSAKEAFENVVADVGCNVPMLDDHDKRVIRETRTGTTSFRGSNSGLPGLPDSQEDVGGWEDYPEIPRPTGWDTDRDGMPDQWEMRKGLDPDDASDGSEDSDGDGYTHIEDYLNWLGAGSPQPASSGLTASATPGPAAAGGSPDDSKRANVGRGGALAGHRHRVLVSTDVGGTDPDDFQSMVHLLVYADVLEIEGLVSSPYGPGGKQHILDVIDCYEKDYANLKTYSDSYPSPDALRALTKQGETERAPYAGVRRSTEGSRWIVHRARRKDPRPLHVLVWGGIEDLAQALHDAPDLLPKLRVYWIGGPNKKWSPDAFQYLVDHFPTLWMIESNATYRGWFVGGDQSGEWGNKAFVSRHIAGKGALGRFFVSKKNDIKMGDTPSVGWLLEGTPADPSQPGWGGRFVRAPERPFRRFERLTTRDDRIEAFSILELALPMGADAPKRPEARLLVENQSLVGHVADDGTMRFRFCPKASKRYRFRIRSNVPALDGKAGEVTAISPRSDGARRAFEEYPNWWTDDPTPKFAEGGDIGAKSVNRWRVDFLRDFAVRMRRCERPRSAALGTIRWGNTVLRQQPEWYGSAEARAVADSVIQYQSPQGGWPKSTDLATPPRTPDDIPPPGRGRANSLDNEATTLPMAFLARVAHATGEAKYRDSFLRGVDYLLAAQYPNGGWPQFWPLRDGYYSRITYNDGAMIRAMTILGDAAGGQPPYSFVDASRRGRAADAVARGIDCILKTQIKQDGKLTAWCAQHDEKTLEPAWARAYEPPSVSGGECHRPGYKVHLSSAKLVHPTAGRGGAQFGQAGPPWFG